MLNKDWCELMLENNNTILCDFKLSKKHKRKVMESKTKKLKFYLHIKFNIQLHVIKIYSLQKSINNN